LRAPRAAALRVREAVRLASALVRRTPREAVRVAADTVRRAPRAAVRVAAFAVWAAPRAVARADDAVRRAAALVVLAEVLRRRRAVGDGVVRMGAEAVFMALRATSPTTPTPVFTTDPTVPRTVPTPEATVSTTPVLFLPLLFAMAIASNRPMRGPPGKKQDSRQGKPRVALITPAHGCRR
jgi:hypothetical protein